jgi:hypothetical protein
MVIPNAEARRLMRQQQLVGKPVEIRFYRAHAANSPAKANHHHNESHNGDSAYRVVGIDGVLSEIGKACSLRSVK